MPCQLLGCLSGSCRESISSDHTGALDSPDSKPKGGRNNLASPSRLLFPPLETTESLFSSERSMIRRTFHVMAIEIKARKSESAGPESGSGEGLFNPSPYILLRKTELHMKCFLLCRV